MSKSKAIKMVCYRGHPRKQDAAGRMYCPTCKNEARLRRLCTIDGCTSLVARSKLCSFHYRRSEKYGDPLGGPPRRGGDLCRNGHPLTGEPKRGRRHCAVCEERRKEQARVCGDCGAPRAKRMKKCAACKRATDLRRSLRNACKSFGITADDYDALLSFQGGVCAICGCKPRTKRLAIDHDHQSGAVRGLLCTRCNHDLLGRAYDNAAILRRAGNYLDSPPATGTSLEMLGEWDDIRLGLLTEEAEQRSESGRWAVLLDERGIPSTTWVDQEPLTTAKAYAVISLELLTELMRIARNETGTIVGPIVERSA